MSVDPSRLITNQVKPTGQLNNHGGGLGGGSSSSYKNKQKKKTTDEFSSSEELDKEINQELMDKSLLTLFKDFILSIYTNVLILFGITKDETEESEEKDPSF